MSPFKNHPLFDEQKDEIEAIIDATHIQIVGPKQIKEILRRIIDLKFHAYKVTIEDLLLFLTHQSYLEKIDFRTYRIETLYCWRTINPYKFMPILRPNGYYSHLTSLYFHSLLDHEPENIYFNNEQSARPTFGNLEQVRIDNAFKSPQRITKSKTIYKGKNYWLLNGKQTGNYGVIHLNTPEGFEVPVTDLERTLIDITVRPAYAGGVESVLKAYRLAQSKISIAKLVKTLHTLNYKYPYHQSVGFYIELAGNYEAKESQTFFKFQPLRNPEHGGQ